LGTNKNTKICSAHFVNNTKSEYPLHPSYLPTIFPGKGNIKKLVQSVQRFERQKRRSNRVIEPEIMNNNHIEMEQYNCKEINVINVPKVNYRSVTCQTDERLNETLNETTYFFCNLNHRDDKYCRSTGEHCSEENGRQDV